MPRRNASLRSIAKSIEVDFLKTKGPIVGGMDLAQVLGFRTAAAFRQAKATGRLPVPVFKLEGRKETYAFAKDIALWLAEQRVKLLAKAAEPPTTKRR